MKTFLYAAMFLAHASFLYGESWVNYAFFFWVSTCFAIHVGVNWTRTSNGDAYIQRLLYWGLISQIPHIIFFHGILPPWSPNFILSLAVGLLIYSRLPSLPKSWDDGFPRWFWYAAYPLHFLLLIAIGFFINAAS